MFRISAAIPQLHAREKQIELRLDSFAYEQATGRSVADMRLPGTAAAALYLTDAVAIEARLLGISRSEFDGVGDGPSVSATTLSAAIFVPVHFGDARGRRGFFVAPGLAVNRSSVSGNFQTDDSRLTTNVSST